MANKLTITYNGSKIVDEAEISGSANITYNGSTIATVAAGETKTLNTNGKYASTNIVVGGKTLNCANKIMGSNVKVEVVTGWDPSAHHRVGGRVFYDNGGSNNYTFYTQDGTVITDTSISGLANAYYYDKSGSGADRFYVFNNKLVESKIWGKYGTQIGSSGVPPYRTNTIGSGKLNTQACLSTTGWESNSIFKYIIGCNNNSLNGCSDWFIASQAEQAKLIESGLVNWYSSKYIWSSVEDNSNRAYLWYYDYSGWYYYRKDNNFACFAARAF